MDGGLDWTATPSLNEPFPYGPCLVAVEDDTALGTAFSEIARRFGFAGREIRGHNSSTEVLAAVMQAVQNCDAKIGVLLLDKRQLLNIAHPRLAPPSQLRHEMACVVAERFLQRHALTRLLCDEDIRGKREQERFRTAILRGHRHRHPEERFKVGFRPSEKSGLIQAADAVAYICSRYVRGAPLATELRQSVDAIRADAENFFGVVEDWEEATIEKLKDDLWP